MHEISKGKCDSFIQAYKHHKCTPSAGGGGRAQVIHLSSLV